MRRLWRCGAMLALCLAGGGGVANAQGMLPRFERDLAVSAQSTDNVLPAYPALLRVAQESGNAVASFVVDTTGRVYPSSIQIAHATQRDFAAAVLEAIPRLRFEPAVDHAGRNVAQLVRQSVEFRWTRGGITQVSVRNEGCTLENQEQFSDVPACASPPEWSTAPRRPISWGWTLGGENVTGAFARSHDYHPGVVAGLQLQFPLSSPRLGLRVDGMFHTMNLALNCAPVDFCVSSVNSVQVATLGLDLVARLNPRSVRWSPYVVGGVGANLSTAGRSATYLASQVGGLQGGVGFEFRLRKATTFAEARYIGLPPGGLAVWNFGFRY